MSEAEAIAANRANWDDRADVHAQSRMYDVDGFLPVHNIGDCGLYGTNVRRVELTELTSTVRKAI
jgi:hypothetical protein